MLPQNVKRRGVMFVLSSASGAGKTTISRLLMDIDPKIHISISATTREPREGEIDGIHYNFLTREDFIKKIANGEFLEYAEVFNHMYGTLKAPVEEILNKGEDVLFDIDWQGTRQLREVARDDIVSVFILPPNLIELENRLRKRAQNSEEEIKYRMSRAMSEISHYDEYHYVVVNYEIKDSLQRVQSILEAERMKRRRMSGLRDFVSNFTKNYDCNKK